MLFIFIYGYFIERVHNDCKVKKILNIYISHFKAIFYTVYHQYTLTNCLHSALYCETLKPYSCVLAGFLVSFSSQDHLETEKSEGARRTSFLLSLAVSELIKNICSCSFLFN